MAACFRFEEDTQPLGHGFRERSSDTFNGILHRVFHGLLQSTVHGCLNRGRKNVTEPAVDQGAQLRRQAIHGFVHPTHPVAIQGRPL